MDGDDLRVSCDAPAEILDAARDILDAYNGNELDRLVTERTTEDVRFVDHRPMSLQSFHGREQARAALGSMREMWPDLRVRAELLAYEGGFSVARDQYLGRDSITGGASELEWFVVDRWQDGRLAGEDIFASEVEARAEFDRQRGAGAANA